MTSQTASNCVPMSLLPRVRIVRCPLATWMRDGPGFVAQGVAEVEITDKRPMYSANSEAVPNVWLWCTEGYGLIDAPHCLPDAVYNRLPPCSDKGVEDCVKTLLCLRRWRSEEEALAALNRAAYHWALVEADAN